ncbi:SH3 domain-containing protein [Teichococcus vastitatis]|uniref:SH3 domain-containing protein n=1 Tax=Teichococcus vastitatis TaxID=2307076 RepID=A0ABS9W236_9PROT|nr:SH3 domain-containing protein [Pseudoroseomonas vastitatis]MCI0752619.1 SH3 domain-containing protein [Pseudoroseomonas vastitatis]
MQDQAGPDLPQREPGMAPPGPRRPASARSAGAAGAPLPASAPAMPQPALPPDPALTGEYGPQPSVSEQRRAILPEAARLLENAELARAYEDFRAAAVALSGAGMLFEMVHRPDPAGGGLVPREPRNLSIAAVPDAALGDDAATVVLMGVGFWEFLPGFFFGSDRIIDGRRIAMDVGSFRFTENTPSGDAEIIGQTEAGPLAQYMRIDISGDGLVKSLAVSNLALGGAFVAAYRAYVEVLAGYPYKLLHPYRQLSQPQARPQSQPAEPARPAPRPVQTGVGALPNSRPPPPPRAAQVRRGPSRAAWSWLVVPPLVALAFYLGSLTSTGEPEDVAGSVPQLAPGSSPQLSPSVPPPARTGSVPPLSPVAEVDLPPPPALYEGADDPPLPLPPPPAPPPPPRRGGEMEAAPPPELAPGPRNLALPDGLSAAGSGYVHPPLAAPPPATTARFGVVRQSANVRASPTGGSPVLRVLATGTTLRIIEENQGWLRVSTEDGEALGWIYGALVR